MRYPFTGGMNCYERRRFLDALDKVHAKRADIVMLHGGGPKDAKVTTAKLADARNVVQIAFKLD